ncbi:Rne/Rng family ribonuclease [Altererythrobacter sp. Root672]|uniref:Rne/Rng family ribonuclease n=1 Tax=Altererythrobacter sp. Root672 TaxID=1736584 RepID=UPI0006FA50A5|nr:Rne/Rng family ribonuclease [Altererythrobacter sp. Root672]KRA83491.1 ribonuclease [Altererythrobacter sp. Root672]
MATRMLIDARHPEETRVAVLKGNRIEEFDFESAEHKQIKGNIYLAKVTRVEPSLQAAFVDFGGNRHGFLAFSEIHPDYYQIPHADREALLAEERAHAEEEAALRADEDEFDDEAEGDDGDLEHSHVEEIDTSEKDDVATIEDGHLENGDNDADEESDEGARDEGDEETGEGDNQRGRRGRGRGRQGRSRAKEMDELRAKRQALRRRYKIQDVIQRRQVLLVQVVKEERGNKGAALTTYLSLAGRYCVLMPNSGHGGGISRKISSAADRKRLKQIVGELSLPKSMGLIVRTAGLQRTKTEIKRDFDYLARLWDEIREKTLASSAPMMIHSDSDLVKRAIRDIYNKEIEEVVVEGEGGYRAAKEFMKLLMPSHARRVKQYADPVPLFQRYGAEDQLSAMYDPVVQLKSGGYLVINPTEALVSIDINSGRSTKEHGIEATALNTNLEAAREIARQLRLRDMAGLVVIDFIDMEYGSNVRKVEKAMKEALKNDRARIQVGRISGFGLMEMSRQRLRTGVLEATTRACPHCDGTGLVRTASSAGLSALRLIEDEAAKGKGTTISLFASTEAAIYLLNAKRADLAEIEERYGVAVEVIPEGEDEGAKMRVGSSGPRPTTVPRFEPIVEEPDDSLPEEYEDEDEEAFEARPERESDGEGRGKRRRRRRGGRGRNRQDERQEEGEEQLADVDGEEAGEERPQLADETTPDGEDRPRKRRRRGGRRRRRGGDGEGTTEGETGEFEGTDTDEANAEPVAEELTAGTSTDEVEAPAPKPRSRRRKAEPKAEEAEAVTEAPVEAAEEPAPKPKRTRRKKADVEAEAQVEAAPAEIVEVAPEPVAEEAPKPKRTRRKKAEEPVEAEVAPEAAPAPEAANDANGEEATGDDEAGSPRRGWWQRTFGE